MVTELVPVAQIIPADYNPRIELKPGDPEYDALVQSVERWGLVQPLVWNRRSGRLVGGHQRLNVLLSRGVEAVECSVVDLSDDDERALSLALNRIAGDWDKTKLYDVLASLHDCDALGATGFGAEELAKLAADATAAIPEAPFTPTLDPAIGDRTVTDAQIASASTKEAGRFAQTKQKADANIVDLTCPFCGKVFGVTHATLDTKTGESPRRKARA